MGEVGDFTITAAVITVSFLIAVTYDIYLYLAKKPTLSAVVYKWGWYKPWIPFLVGFLCGHWFF